MTVVIYHQGNTEALIVTLVNLQPQLSTSDDIYIVDVSKDRSGLKVAEKYGTTRSYVFVEVGNYTFDQAVGFGLQSMRENKQDGALIINGGILASQTFITNLKKAAIVYDFLKPHSYFLSVSQKMDPNFSWFNQVGIDVDSTKAIVFVNCFYIKSPVSSLKKVGILNNETVLLL